MVFLDKHFDGNFTTIKTDELSVNKSSVTLPQNEVMGMTSALLGLQRKHKSWLYLEAASQSEGAGQSACCSPSGSASHMTRTGETGFCYSGPDSPGGGRPTNTEARERKSCVDVNDAK